MIRRFPRRSAVPCPAGLACRAGVAGLARVFAARHHLGFWAFDCAGRAAGGGRGGCGQWLRCGDGGGKRGEGWWCESQAAKEIAMFLLFFLWSGDENVPGG
jgi:hypothetical protein